MNFDIVYLQKALQQAKLAERKNEVPVGCVLVVNQQIIARGHNLKEHRCDATMHAEMITLQKAMRKTKDWRLTESTLYSTLEPCPMCAGALLHARVKRIVYGAKDIKWGAAGSIIDLFKPNLFNHHIQVDFVPYEPCAQLLRDFFAQLRDEKYPPK